jgi:pimeloyl-ACP methyl ester carboxylesterase
VPSLLVVDITPGVTREKAKHIHDFIEGPPDFPSFSEIFDRTVQFNPTRTKESLRRGIIHNAQRQADGSWQWRYDRRGRADDAPAVDRAGLWDDVDAFDDDLQYMLARGGGEGSVVDDADVEELIGRRPSARVEIVRDAGHSIQGDQPLALAAIIDALLDDSVL